MKKSWYPLYKCLRPRSIINPYTRERIMVGCDKCAACMQRRSARSQLQIRLEAKDSYKVIFGTLTFANTYVPRAVLVPNGNIHLDGCEYNLVVKDTGEILGTERLNPKDVEELKEKLYLFGDIPYLYKRDAQLFIKRVRKYLTKHYGEEKIRYFICGEYAPEHFRPHFHFLIFLQSRKFLENSGKNTQRMPRPIRRSPRLRTLYVRVGSLVLCKPISPKATLLHTFRATLLALCLYPKFLKCVPSVRSRFILSSSVSAFLKVNERKYTKRPLGTLCIGALSTMVLLRSMFYGGRLTLSSSQNVKDILISLHVCALQLTASMPPQWKNTVRKSRLSKSLRK